nr:MAG TPA: hypothetical protein [Caudoviricetes sp.]
MKMRINLLYDRDLNLWRILGRLNYFLKTNHRRNNFRLF